MKNTINLFVLILFLFVSCRNEENQCREPLNIESFRNTGLTKTQIIRKQLDSLLIEAQNLSLCEECETTDWEITQAGPENCYVPEYIPYTNNIDTALFFNLINEYNLLVDDYFISQYKYDTINVNGTISYTLLITPCLIAPKAKARYVECKNGIPIITTEY